MHRETLHFLCNLPVCNVMHSNQPAFSTIALLPWRQKQQGALECCYIPTRLHGVTSQRTIIITVITISTILHFNTNNTNEHIHIPHNLQTGVTKKLYIMYLDTCPSFYPLPLYSHCLVDLPWWYHILYHTHHKVTTKFSGYHLCSLKTYNCHKQHTHTS